MHPLRILMVSACVAPLLGGPAGAQTQMYPGQDVQVNPAGIKGGQVLLYPGGTMARVVPPLREPGGRDGVIHLHMPVKHHAVRHVAAQPVQSAPVESQAAAPQAEAPMPVRPAKKRRVAMTPPPEPASSAPAPEATAPQAEGQSSGAAIPFSFDSSSRSQLPSSPAPLSPAPKQAPSKPATKLATATPPPATTSTTGEVSPPSRSGGALTRRGRILFAKDATEPVPAAASGLSMLAGDLNNSLLNGSDRIELLAYGGPRNDKSSDARRISLKRALTIRQLLIDRGVPSSRIDVRAMGGADSGDPDRVDVFVTQG